MKPAVVKDHRLAFNMRGFPPLEPSMGGIEPCVGSDCHGALIELTRANYEKIWLSEGGGAAKPGYEQIIVDAVPYGSGQAVKAIAFRAAEHARLHR